MINENTDISLMPKEKLFYELIERAKLDNLSIEYITENIVMPFERRYNDKDFFSKTHFTNILKSKAGAIITTKKCFDEISNLQPKGENGKFFAIITDMMPEYYIYDSQFDYFYNGKCFKWSPKSIYNEEANKEFSKLFKSVEIIRK